MSAVPTPFEIETREDGSKVASNGTSALLVDAEGDLKRRRAISIINTPPAGERLLPMLSQLSGDILHELDMPTDKLLARLQHLVDTATPPPQVRKEWAKATLDGVNVFFDGTTVVVTKQDLWP